MLRKIEYLIPAALKAIDSNLEKHYREENKGKGIPKGYQGAASGFGTTLMQMGLLPTLAVYTDKDSKADIERPRLLMVLLDIVKEDPQFQLDKKPLSNFDDLLRKVIAESENWKDAFTEQLLKASLAFKLAIRTYHLEEPKKNKKS